MASRVAVAAFAVIVALYVAVARAAASQFSVVFLPLVQQLPPTPTPTVTPTPTPTPQPNFVTQWGQAFGSGNGQFNHPLGVAVDTAGNVYVVDSGNYRIEKFTSNGAFLSQWGSAGTGNGQF